jgi:hypothetical protein
MRPVHSIGLKGCECHDWPVVKSVEVDAVVGDVGAVAVEVAVGLVVAGGLVAAGLAAGHE